MHLIPSSLNGFVRVAKELICTTARELVATVVYCIGWRWFVGRKGIPATALLFVVFTDKGLSSIRGHILETQLDLFVISRGIPLEW